MKYIDLIQHTWFDWLINNVLIKTDLCLSVLFDKVNLSSNL